MIEDYEKAKKLGERAYRRALVRGEYPYLPALEDMLREAGRFPEISLGLAEIPLELVVGTRTSGRQNAFASNFMPLMGENTEFAAKWSALVDAQVEEGIREPVKAYEFMNRFYIEEGNKRVSVLRYLGAVTIPAQVIRIRPPRDASVQSRIYYEFLDFYQVTHMFEITFSEPGRYEQLAQILGRDLRDPWPDELLEKLHAGYTAFRAAYLARGGGKLPQTIADALLVYLRIYSLDSLLRDGEGEIDRRLVRLWQEFLAALHPGEIALIENREDAEAVRKERPIEKAARLVEKTVEKTGAAGVAGAAQIAGTVAGAAAGLSAGGNAAEAKAEVKAEVSRKTKEAIESGISHVVPQILTETEQRIISPAHPLKIAFIHDRDVENSGWVYGHELGRNHLREAFGSLVVTLSFENCADEESIFEAFETVRQENCGLVFTTSSSLVQPSLRFAVDNPGVKVLNCSLKQAPRAIRFYYGKMYEAKYLTGALAASLTDDHRIVYTAGRRDQAAVSSVNAFALGAQLIDPYCRVSLRWSGDDEEIRETGGPGETGNARGIHVFSDLDMVRLRDENRRYGLYLREDGGGFRRLAASIWNWGAFYEIVVRRVMDGTYDSIPAQQKDRAVNYWFGISSGIIDILLSEHLPAPSYRLVELLRAGIAEGRVHPFAGQLRAQDGTMHGEKDSVLPAEEIISMDWLVENVDGEISGRE
ncbi:MAG: BMP family ABC transporter substrate-binding protein [Eubacteriales bacterium]|nr:BMP family ABC transporter substrate-binding protein [Eubacteriales bacterium]